VKSNEDAEDVDESEEEDSDFMRGEERVGDAAGEDVLEALLVEERCGRIMSRWEQSSWCCFCKSIYFCRA
jgi:hypothetical protein